MSAPAQRARASEGTTLGGLLEHLDRFRLNATRQLDTDHRAEMGQFLTPPPTARFMGSLFTPRAGGIRLLDAGAGVGSLSAAFVQAACAWPTPPESIAVVAYEVDVTLAVYLRAGLDLCRGVCEQSGVRFSSEVRETDFIEDGVARLQGGLFAPVGERFDCAILNPPYRKINTDSATRRLLRQIGVETSNLYTGFLSVVIHLLASGGQLVAITPRSFCNGLYFRPFRELFLDAMSLRRVHVFETRHEVFQEDDVLQENIIFHALKDQKPLGGIVISSSAGPADDLLTCREVAPTELVRPDDPDRYIHIVPDDLGAHVAARMARCAASLPDLGLSVSTGRVVDFRATQWLRAEPDAATAPLIYPGHLQAGFVTWPRSPAKKPNAMLVTERSAEMLVPAGFYVLVKRFSSKEERRRVVAAVYDPTRLPDGAVAFENHLNYYHCGGRGLSALLAKGLAAFLNSTLVDLYFRQFSGHTQVNATDLRSLRYPSQAELEALGARIGDTFPSQHRLDQLVREELLAMADTEGSADPVSARKKVEEALAVFKDLGLPRRQRNDRSALTLLALLDLTPAKPWSAVAAPLCGIRPMMDFMAEHYGKKYAENSRETVRRQTVHQFQDAGLLVKNPDDSLRPINSDKTVYQIEPSTLDLLRTFDTPEWDRSLRTYLASQETLIRKYAQAREMDRIPVVLADGGTLMLSPGGQNVLVKEIIDQFCSRFTPGAKLVYVGDTDTKWAHYDDALLAGLNVTVDYHGKMPDVVVYDESRNWLVLVEAVTSHGPVDAKRRDELSRLFQGCTADLVYVTAFLNRKAMTRYLGDISWETEVWVAEAPGHLIHFDGERSLGPYPEVKL